MNEKANNLVISIAKSFIEYALASTQDDWEEAFLRFEAGEDMTGVTCIYRTANDSAYFRSKSKFEFYSEVEKLFVALRDEIKKEAGKDFCVCLLRIDSSYNYNIYYEYADSQRWLISKLDGQSGIPRID